MFLGIKRIAAPISGPVKAVARKWRYRRNLHLVAIARDKLLTQTGNRSGSNGMAKLWTNLEGSKLSLVVLGLCVVVLIGLLVVR